MKYFYIFGNICSILGFIAAIITLRDDTNILGPYKWLIIGLIVFTVIFWLIFYIKPHGRISKFIDSRIDFTGKYTDTGNQTHDIIEGIFEVNLSNLGTKVMLPPFEKMPIIRILYCIDKDKDKLDDPIIEYVSEDYFTVKIYSSTQTGKWKWRARGKLLKIVDEKTKKNGL